MSGPIAISVSRVSKRYRLDRPTLAEMLGLWRAKRETHQALTDVTFDVAHGESIGVIGRNGSGKSTLLQIIAGTLSPTKGEVQVDGKVAALLELGSGFSPELTGRENIRLNAALLGLSADEVAELEQPIIEFSELGDFINRPVKTYSSGMLVRAAFSVQVHVKPSVLIVDEALSVGDVFFQQKCMHRIRRILDDGVTLLYVSHAIGTVKSLCSRAIYLRNGVVVGDGDAHTICDAYLNETTDLKAKPAELNLRSAPAAVAEEQGEAKDHWIENPDFARRIVERSGGQEVSFVGAALLSESGQVITGLDAASTCRIRLCMQASEDVAAGACIGVLLRDYAGNDLVALNSNFYGAHMPAMKKGDRLVWELKVTLPFARGAYTISIGIKPDPETMYFYDRCFNALVFEVQGNPPGFGSYRGRFVLYPDEARLVRIVS